MARVLSEGTEADRAEVWLRVGEELRLAASWPAGGATAASLRLESGEPPPIPDAASAVPVRYQGELLGAVAVMKREDITPTETRLVNDLAHGGGAHPQERAPHRRAQPAAGGADGIPPAPGRGPGQPSGAGSSATCTTAHSRT